MTDDDRRLLRWARTTAWAASYVKHYSGRSRFLKDLRAKALADPSWVPTTKQTQTIARIVEGGNHRR